MSRACERVKREKENINKKVKDEGAAENESKDGDEEEVQEKFRPSAPPQPQACELVVRTKAAKSKTYIILKYILRWFSSFFITFAVSVSLPSSCSCSSSLSSSLFFMTSCFSTWLLETKYGRQNQTVLWLFRN